MGRAVRRRRISGLDGLNKLEPTCRNARPPRHCPSLCANCGRTTSVLGALTAQALRSAGLDRPTRPPSPESEQHGARRAHALPFHEALGLGSASGGGRRRGCSRQPLARRKRSYLPLRLSSTHRKHRCPPRFTNRHVHGCSTSRLLPCVVHPFLLFEWSRRPCFAVPRWTSSLGLWRRILSVQVHLNPTPWLG